MRVFLVIAVGFLLMPWMAVPCHAGGTNADLPPAASAADLSKKRLDMLKTQPLSVDAIFDGATFPKVEFLNPDLVTAGLGPYTITTRFFDAQWNEVTAPKSPGRYGAMVSIRTAAGISDTRRVTLFKTTQPYSSAKSPYAAKITFPDAFGLSEETVAQESWNISDWTSGTLDDAATDGDWPVLLAGLHDIAADPSRNRGFSVWKINNDWWSELRRRQGENQDYKFITQLPDGYDASKKTWPLLLFLHGSGERGDDLERVRKWGPLAAIKQGVKIPMIIITPQCPEQEHWDPVRLARLLDQVEAADRVDPKRIYVTGLSMGGFGSFDLAATYPDRIAAIAPLSGGEDPALAQRLRKMPAWIFHGAEDNVVPTHFSVDLAHAMQKLGAPVKLTIYPGVGHEKWDVTYSNPELYSWFLAHSK